MKVLFVSSGNSKEGISPIVKNQGESLKAAECDLEYFTVINKGLFGYISAIFRLRKRLAYKKHDVVHAHYSLSSFVASLAGAKPLVVSLMGSDVNEREWYKWLIKFFARFFWDITIVKSKKMKDSIKVKGTYVLPNGVNLSLFKHKNKNIACQQLNWALNKKHVLFAANPNRYEKNYALASTAINILKRADVDLHFLADVNITLMPVYFSASDVVILTSLWEGSPNVIKEAMACNCPIVSTDVGDVKEIIGDTDGCYLTSFQPSDVADKIELALKFSENIGRTNGRNRIIKLGLDSETIAAKIINLYSKVLG